MGGNRLPLRARPARRGAAALTIVAVALIGCNSDDPPTADVVDSADAITATVAWEADEQDPVLDADGEAQLPVIYVVADDGAAIDVGVQADVAAATADWATVRFADDVTETFDPDLDGEPVRDDGVMLLIGPIPEPAPSIELDVVRYRTVDDGEPLRLEITADTEPDGTDPDNTPTAMVTAVTRP